MRNALLILIILLSLTTLTNCSASVNSKLNNPPITHRLCTMPDPPAFEKIELDDPDNVKLLKLYNNITRLKAYTEKLKAVIVCLKDGEEKKE